jgi:hypothetical protein
VQIQIRLISLILWAFTVVIVTAPATANEQAFRPNSGTYPPDSVIFFVDEAVQDSARVLTSAGFIFASTEREISSGLPNWGWCSSTTDPDCDFKELRDAGGLSLLSVCTSNSDLNCIESISFARGDGQFKSANFSRYIEGPTVAEDARFNYFGGNTASIWTTGENTSSSDIQSFVVAPVVTLNFDGELDWFKPVDFSLQVIPFQFKLGNYRADRWATREEIMSGTQFAGLPSKYRPKVSQGPRGDYDCFHYETGRCLVQYGFPAEITIKVAVRLTNKIGGWFKGRLDQPDISVQPLNSESNRIVITAKPVKVPRMRHVVNYSSMNARESELLKRWFYAGARPEPLLAGSISQGEFVFEFVEQIREVVNDASAGETEFWVVGTAAADQSSRCLTDTSRVLGIVTTNAMGFQGTAPTFDGTSLNYRVVGLHYKSDGKSLQLGNYNLVMSNEVVKCLYGLSDAPVSATISIAGTDSQQVISTTIVNSRDGWLKLRADNFTFSEKNIKVELRQSRPPETTAPANSTNAAAESTKETNPQAVSASKKAVRIICVKKGAKNIRVTKSSCPKGYKIRK